MRSRGQALTEFALVAPLLLLLTFAIIDLGRAVYAYSAISLAANEGARLAIRGQAPDFAYPSDEDVAAAVQARTPGLPLRLGPCPNGPLSEPGPGSGFVFITAPPGSVDNAPGGASLAAPGGCDAVSPAHSHEPLTITVVYGFQPATPFFSQLYAGGIPLRAHATYHTEY